LNINDIKTEAPSGVDMLQAIFERQLELETKYHGIEKANGFKNLGVNVDLDSPAAQSYIKDAAYRVVEELSEATNCLKNKPWKTTHVPTDQQHYFEELMDALHFFVRLCLISGLTAEDVFKLYFKKSEVNKFRQESDY
jgi:dimeric dUTPase (all-alpha-NTP-PPase superfamily)